jgi:hypothetical protein
MSIPQQTMPSQQIQYQQYPGQMNNGFVDPRAMQMVAPMQSWSSSPQTEGAFDQHPTSSSQLQHQMQQARVARPSPLPNTATTAHQTPSRVAVEIPSPAPRNYSSSFTNSYHQQPQSQPLQQFVSPQSLMNSPPPVQQQFQMPPGMGNRPSSSSQRSALQQPNGPPVPQQGVRSSSNPKPQVVMKSSSQSLMQSQASTSAEAKQAKDDMPKIAYNMVLLSLSDEYIEAAHKLGPRVAFFENDEDIEAYNKLIAAGLTCIECAMKVLLGTLLGYLRDD